MSTRRGKKFAISRASNNWDAVWDSLSVDARRAFLNAASKLADSHFGSHHVYVYPAMSASAFAELSGAGLITNPWKSADRSSLAFPPAAVDFANRIGFLERRRPLRRDNSGLANLDFDFHGLNHHLIDRVYRVVRRLGLSEHLPAQSMAMVLLSPRWQEQVLTDLGRDPAAVRLVSFFRERTEPLLLADLPGEFPDLSRDAVAFAVENLREHFVLFEDVEEKSNRLMIGMPAVVREKWRRWQARSAGRPAMSPCAAPAHVGPAGGYFVPDLRSFLIEVMREPLRVKATGEIFVKEWDRLADVFVPMPDWFATNPEFTPKYFYGASVRFAERMGLVDTVERDKRIEMCVNVNGRNWLQRPAAEQYATFVEHLADLKEQMQVWDPSDSYYLQSGIIALPKERQNGRRGSFHVSMEVVTPLRVTLGETLARLPIRQFVTLSSFINHAAFGPENPLFLGRKEGESLVLKKGNPVPPFPEDVDDAGAELLRDLILYRLIPFGAMQAGWNGSELLIARQPLCDLYFGRITGPLKLDAPDSGRVIVQPDFTVLIIGTNQAPAVDLAPLCDRKPGPANHGTLQFRLTKPSVVRAATAGIPAEEILKRLERHSSVPIPANVRHEVGEWAGQVLHLGVEIGMLLRCPNAQAAACVRQALGSIAEQVSDTLVTVPKDNWTPAVRKKLLDAGLIVPPPPEGDEHRRRFRY
jgi:hypothetical protein